MHIRVFVATAASLLTILASSQAQAGAYSNAVLASNPVAYYRLDETVGTTAANVSIHGVALDGSYTNFGTTTPPSTIGEFGPRPNDPSGTATIHGFESDNFAIQTAANSSVQVTVPDNALLDITGALTLEAWVFRNAQTTMTQNNEGIIGKFIGSPSGQDHRAYALYYDPRTTTPAIGFVLNTNGTSSGNVDLRTTTNIPLGSTSGWTHVAAVYEPNVRMSVYINGVSVGEKTTGLPAAALHDSSAPLWIGRQFSPTATNTSFEGKIDEVAVYSTALSPATILAHYQAATLNAGDFDGDGDVDGADFIAWQTNHPTGNSATLGQGDSDYDGDVDGADFAAWQGSFPIGPGPGVSPIPEPSSIILTCCGIWMLVFSRRRAGLFYNR
jgi:hypothetical protein